MISQASTTPFRLTDAAFWAAVAAALLALWVFTAPGLFTVDEFFYQQMASAMAAGGHLSFAEMRLDGVPAVDMVFAFPAGDGRLTPQYPSGYALIAAPFYAALGVKGLMLVNTFAAFASCLMTDRIARRLEGGEQFARTAVALFVFCTFATTYSAAVWPHMMSVAIAAAIVYLALAGAQDARAASFVAAGLLTGVGCAIRIDTIVLAPAVFLWARLAGTDKSRLCLLYFSGGLLAGLAVPAGLNFLKFGTLNPFTYQNAMPQNDPALFLAPALAVAGGLTLIYCVDAVKILRAATRPDRAIFTFAAAFVFLLLVAAMSEKFRTLLGGYHAFLIDQQAFAFADRLSGVTRNEFGFLIFFGVLKKALLQSAPFAAIAILPIVQMAKGKLPSGARLLLFACAAYVSLYALNQTDSGLAANQRFLVPILPFVSILAAMELSKISKVAGASARFRFYAVGAGFAFMTALLVAHLSPSAATYFGVLYAPLAIALSVAGLALFMEFRRTSRAAVMAGFALYVAFGASAAGAFGDLLWTMTYREISREEAAKLSAAAPSGAMVLTDRINFWGDRASKDLSLIYWSNDRRDEITAAIDAFLEAGRPVYAHGVIAFEAVRRAGCAVEEIPIAASRPEREFSKVTACGQLPRNP